MRDQITIQLSPSAALVLFEFLTRVDDGGDYKVEHPAEQKALWLLEGMLEKQVPVFSSDYKDLLNKARNELIT